MFFREDVYFSEDCDYGYDPRTSKEYLAPNIKITYWPAPTKRERPEWLDEIRFADKTLGDLTSEIYTALNNDLSVLAAIGVRTSLDRSSELLGVNASLPFDKKIEALFVGGKIGEAEKGVLGILIDAGSAAAHRGWSPSADALKTMMNVLEAFLHRSFILGDGLASLKASVPSKPKGEKRASAQTVQDLGAK